MKLSIVIRVDPAGMEIVVVLLVFFAFMCITSYGIQENIFVPLSGTLRCGGFEAAYYTLRVTHRGKLVKRLKVFFQIFLIDRVVEPLAIGGQGGSVDLLYGSMGRLCF